MVNAHGRRQREAMLQLLEGCLHKKGVLDEAHYD